MLASQIWRFGVTGLINTALGLAVILTLHIGAGLGLFISNAAGYAAGFLVSFLLNRHWTFSSVGPTWPTACRFFVVLAASYSISMIMIISFLTLNVSYLAAQFMGLISYSVISFLGMRHVVFVARH